MHPTVIAFVVLGFTFGGALFGMWLRARLPDHHLSADARDTIKLGVGLVATLTALVLGLLTASAKHTLDTLDETVKHSAVQLLSLDRALARYGPETAGIRAAIKGAVAQRIDVIWSRDRGRDARKDSTSEARDLERFATDIHQLAPRTDEQRVLRARALVLAESLLDARWIIVAARSSKAPYPFLTVLLLWLTITFTVFGMLAPRNKTLFCVLFVCALSVAGAIFLVLEMDSPFDGLIGVSPDPMDYAVEHMNR